MGLSTTVQNSTQRTILLVCIVIGVVVLDVGTKVLARSLNLSVIENFEGPFGVFSHVFIIPLSIVALYVFYVMYRTKTLSTVEHVCLALIIGGGIANFGERIYQGFVTDIFYLWIAAWNVADIAIILGVGGIGILVVRSRVPKA